jgi:hypothetical protein
VVGGLSIAQAKSLAKAGLRAFVISGNMGLPDGNARYNLPPRSSAWSPVSSPRSRAGSASVQTDPLPGSDITEYTGQSCSLAVRWQAESSILFWFDTDLPGG